MLQKRIVKMLLAFSFIFIATGCNETLETPEGALSLLFRAAETGNQELFIEATTEPLQTQLRYSGYLASLKRKATRLKSNTRLQWVDGPTPEGLLTYNLVYDRRGSAYTSRVVGEVQIRCVHTYNAQTEIKSQLCQVADLIFLR